MNIYIELLISFVGTFVAVLLFFVFYLIIKKLYRKKGKTNEQLTFFYKKISEDIKYAVSPKFVELSLGVNDLIDLAIEIWRIEQRIVKSTESLPENQLKGLENSVQKMKRYIEKYDIEIIDYKNTKYNDGLNLDVLSIEKDPTLSESTVKETIEPTILCKGQVVRKAKIILIKNH